jgi:hypothetical protein
VVLTCRNTHCIGVMGRWGGTPHLSADTPDTILNFNRRATHTAARRICDRA